MAFTKYCPQTSLIKRALALAIAFPGWGCESFQDPPPPAAQEVPTPAEVVARGKIIPQWDVIKLSVPNAEDSRVNRLFVKEGDRVQPNTLSGLM